MAIHYRPASNFSLAELADLYTRTFAAYFYDAVITAEDMARFMRVEQLDLSLSPVQCVDEEPAGLATLCRRGDRVNCRGFGVTLPYRGRGLAHHLAQTMLEWARAAGATSLRLGVLVQNEGAVRTYLAAGLHIQRQLVSYEWRAYAPPSPNPFFPRVEEGESDSPSPLSGRGGWEVRGIEERDPAWLLDHFDALHTVPTIWTHEPMSLRLMERLRGLAIVEDEQPLAYVLVEPDAEGGAQILDLAATRPDQAVALLLSLQQTYELLTCGNEPATSPVVDALPVAGFTMTHTRYEMVAYL